MYISYMHMQLYTSFASNKDLCIYPQVPHLWDEAFGARLGVPSNDAASVMTDLDDTQNTQLF